MYFKASGVNKLPKQPQRLRCEWWMTHGLGCGSWKNVISCNFHEKQRLTAIKKLFIAGNQTLEKIAWAKRQRSEWEHEKLVKIGKKSMCCVSWIKASRFGSSSKIAWLAYQVNIFESGVYTQRVVSVCSLARLNNEWCTIRWLNTLLFH